MPVYGEIGGNIGSLLRLIQQERDAFPHGIPAQTDPTAPLRNVIQAPVVAPESPESSRVVSIKPEGVASSETPTLTPSSGGVVVPPVVPAPVVSPVAPVAPELPGESPTAPRPSSFSPAGPSPAPAVSPSSKVFSPAAVAPKGPSLATSFKPAATAMYASPAGPKLPPPKSTGTIGPARTYQSIIGQTQPSTAAKGLSLEGLGAGLGSLARSLGTILSPFYTIPDPYKSLYSSKSSKSSKL